MSENITRTTISVPKDLKEQMEAENDRVNWSAVAVQAFRQKLLEIEYRRKNRMSKKDVVNRLKAAQEADTEDYDDGKAAGREFAEKQATLKELNGIAKYIELLDRDPRTTWWDIDAPGWNAPLGAVGGFANAARRKIETWQDAEEFWQGILGDDFERIHDADFFHGFGDGAMEVLDEVQDQL
jgi:hypothetical protein